MASDKIKGLTVKIGADTSDFIKELKKVDKEINLTNKQANELQKGLELEFDEGRFVEAQRLVRQSLEQTEEKAKAIREQLKFLEDSGAVDTDGYKKLQTELYKTENNAVLLKQKLEDINNVKTEGISGKFKKFFSELKTGTVIAGAVVAGLTKITTSAVNAGDEIQTTADKFDISAEAVQRWNYVALQTDVSSEQLYKGITKVRDAVGTALVGETNTATKALQDLGVSFDKIGTGEEAFETIIGKLSEVKDSTLQAYYANEIFGERIATDLIPLIRSGADTIGELNLEFESLGALTNEEVRELADFDNRMNEITTKVKNLTYQLGLVLVPVLELVFSMLEPFIPLLELILDLITPIIEGLSKFMQFSVNTGLTILGKGWLWGKDDKNSSSSSVSNVSNYNDYDYTVPSNSSVNNSNYEDNSTTNITINTELTGDLNYDTKTLADSVIKEIVTRKQASGR